MSRSSHPPTLLTFARRTLREECGLAAGDVVLCACSGGPDSTALLHVLARLRRALGHEVVAHGVDHGLRAEAAAELASVGRVAADLGVAFTTTRVAVARGGNLQARARDARHAALADFARRIGASVVALGHTADDRAETVLLRLLRGTSVAGLAVMPPRDAGPAGIELVRPLVRARRSDVTAHLARHGLPSSADPSNLDPRFMRTRVRREVLPVLEGLSPAIVEHLCRLADDALEAGAEPLDVPPELGRAQRAAVARARRLGRKELALRLAGGREVRVTFPEGRIVITGSESGDVASPPSRASPFTSTPPVSSPPTTAQKLRRSRRP